MRFPAMFEFSGILFANPSFLRGAARVMDLGATMTDFNRSPSGSKADALALYADWSAIGDSIRQQIEAYRAEVKRGIPQRQK